MLVLCSSWRRVAVTLTRERGEKRPPLNKGPVLFLAGTTETYLCIARTGHVDVLVAVMVIWWPCRKGSVFDWCRDNEMELVCNLTSVQCKPGGEKVSETAGVVNSLTLIKP